MRSCGLVLTASIFLGQVVPGLAADNSSSTGPQGRWFVVHRAYSHTPKTQPVGNFLTSLGSELEIKDGKLGPVGLNDPSRTLKADFRGGSPPQAVDLQSPGENGQILHGIYRIDGSILSLAIGDGNQRPKSFRPQEGQVLLVLKRAPGQ
jgi:hypothetical protein